MRRLSVAAAAGVVTAALAVGCGDGAVKAPGRISEEDLPDMLLQREDVPSRFRPLPLATLGVKEDGQTAARAGLLAEFELPPEQAGPGETVCISNEVTLYDTPDSARGVLPGAEEYAERLAEGPGEFETQLVDVPAVGDQRWV